MCDNGAANFSKEPITNSLKPTAMADNIKDNIGSLDCTEKRSLKPFHSTPEMHEIIQVPLNSPENHTKQSVESERAGMLLHKKPPRKEERAV